MRKSAIIFLAVLVTVSSIYGHDHKRHKSKWLKNRIGCLDRMDISIDDGGVILYPKHDDDDDDDRYVEITDDYRLYINGRRIRTNNEQKEYLAEYHDQVFEIVDEAKRIGWEGAKVGVHGAKVGLTAAMGVFKLILPGYGTKDLERDVEREAKKLEAKAEKLEKEAEKIEDMADDLEDMHYTLKRKIPELRKLRWFR